MSSMLSPSPHILYTEIQRKLDPSSQWWIGISIATAKSKSNGCCGYKSNSNHQGRTRKRVRRDVRACAFWPELFRPDSLEMESVRDCEHFDQILEQAKHRSQPILVDWMAAWCRKCIYLKPKLEKLAVDYDNKIKFYCIDVNSVPQALVKRGNISKMPTIQIWKDGEMKAQVIGGHKAWLVVEEVGQMIQQFV